MRFLLDVNALLALGFQQHVFHHRVDLWINSLALGSLPQLATSAITELGFVRVLSQLPEFSITVAEAASLLAELKRSPKVDFSFIADNQGVESLPSWVKTARQTTDGHLSALARAHQCQLATLDAGIPDAFFIPS